MNKLLYNFCAIFILVLASSCVQNTNSDNPVKIKAKLPFKTFLKSKNISIEVDIPNEFETFQRENKYANYYFGVSTILPLDWKIDRGVSEFTLIRAVNEQESSSMTMLAIPIEISDSAKAEENQRKYSESPLKTMNSIANGDFRKKMYDEVSASTNTKLSNFKVGEEFIGATNYLKFEYEFVNKLEGNSFAFKTIGYQVILWGVNYTISYTAPLEYFDDNLIKQSLINTNYKRVKSIK